MGDPRGHRARAGGRRCSRQRRGGLAGGCDADPVRRRSGRRHPARPGRRAVRLLRVSLHGRLVGGCPKPRLGGGFRRSAPASRSEACRPISGSGSGSGWPCWSALAWRWPFWRWRARSGCCGFGSGPAAALEIPEEGPELGERVDVIERFGPAGDASLRSPSSPPRAAACAAGSSRRSPHWQGIRRSRSRRSTRSQTARCGPSCGSRAARSRSPSIRTAPCSPRGPSTIWPSSRACWPPPSGAGRAWLPRAVRELMAERDRSWRGPRLAGGGHLPPGVPWPGRLWPGGGDRRRDRRQGREARRSGRVPLLRPHASPPAPASTRWGFPGSTRAATRSVPATAGRSTTSAGWSTPRGCRFTKDGGLKRDPDGLALPPAPRTKVCQQTAKAYGFDAHLQGAWYRCCGGTVRKLWDCCAHHDRRINGDAALHGYCYGGRKVFCVTYYQTNVPC